MTKEVGLSLRDIGGLHEDVPVGDSFIRVKGISARVALNVINRFPAQMVGALQKGEFNVSVLLKNAPEVIDAIIAAGTGGAEEDAAGLPIEVQADILEAIGRLTFRSGFGPFVQRVKALGAGLGSGNFGAAPGTKSPQALNG